MKETSYKDDLNQVLVTPLFSWFRGDFGGKSGVIQFLKSYSLIPSESNPELVFLDYDWTLSLGNYYAE